MPKVIDITADLERCPAWAGDRTFRRRETSRLADGGTCNLSVLEMSAHNGTHVDAPSHFLAGRATLDTFEPASFILPAAVVDIPSEAQMVRAEHLQGRDELPGEGEAVLFRTGNTEAGRMRRAWDPGFVALAPDAAEACAGLGVAMVGVDYLSVDCFGAAREHPSHTILMSRKILLLEGLDLTAAAPGRYTLICLPLKMPGAEGSPVRAVLLPEVRTL